MRAKRLIPLLAALLLLAACGLIAEDQEAAGGDLIYYLAEEASGSDAIRAEAADLSLPEDASLQERAEAVVERLIAGPEASDLASPIPQGVTLRSLELQDQRAVVDFSSGFGQLGGVDLTLADYCLTLSLTALEGITSVTVTVQGRTMAQQPKQVLRERDVLLSTMDDKLQTVEATLYFLNESGELAGERRTLDIYEGQTLAENLIAALLEGPEDRALTAAIPEGFGVIGVWVTDGVCYLNLSSESLAELPEDEETQRLILWSFAESLYSLETVESLWLLSDGEELTHFGSIPVESVAVRPQG